MVEETLEAKLRNQLTPIYGLAEMVLALDKNGFQNHKLKELVVETAKQVQENQLQIVYLLQQIENKTIVGNIGTDCSISGITFSQQNPVKACDCKRQFDSTAKFMCDGNCR